MPTGNQYARDRAKTLAQIAAAKDGLQQATRGVNRAIVQSHELIAESRELLSRIDAALETRLRSP